ncbi:MAG: hypothetical protein ACTSRI_05925 [Promethearchaeota archaeon]
MSKDIKNVIDGVESSEKEVSILQTKIERLTELVEKQKLIMSEQEALLQQQKNKISDMFDIPEDIVELKELIGSQRALINEKEIQLEFAKGEAAQAVKELELSKNLIIPIQDKLEQSYITLGQLKTELTEKKAELLLLTEDNKNLQKQVDELSSLSDKVKDGQFELLTEAKQKYLEEIERLKKQHVEEKQELISKITDLDTTLLDSKLGITEKTSEAKDFATRFDEIKEKQENLINKLEELMEENREAKKQIRSQDEKMENLRKFKEENFEKIHYFDKLRVLMETEPIFRTFLILSDFKKGIHLEDLRKALGSPIVLVKKFVQQLQDIELVDINDDGKIILKSIEE